MTEVIEYTKEQKVQFYKEHYQNAKNMIENLKEEYPENDLLQKELKKLAREIKGMNMFK
ncbi:hypothetical protein ACFTQ7_13175 [Lysinibacillus sp. NPDC056959]|uniref:hypothetical protein n=1 Tax=Lysinibacillus sp. NPDC056959 TaxID=3345981 RepID=UPI003637708A